MEGAILWPGRQDRKHEENVIKSAICILVLLLFATPSLAGEKQVAITFDDLPASQVATFQDQLKVNQRILDVLGKYQVKAAGFVIASRLDGRTDILDLWLDQGNELGNHTYSHMDFDKVEPDAFRMDVNKGASKLQEILKKHNANLTYFRFPYFHEGRTAERKEAVRRFLNESGYVIAPVTLNLSDPEYNELFLKAWGSNDKRQQDSIKAGYLEQVRQKTEDAETLARELLGREVKHILLLHLNRINAETLDQILGFYSESGYSFITLKEALQDSVYSLKEEYVGSEELTWLERLKRSLEKK